VLGQKLLFTGLPLTGVVQTATYGGAVDHTVDYAYDYANRLVFRTVDAGRSGGTVPIQESAYVYDGNQIALQFDKIVGGPSALSASDLSHRYLWGPAIDQLLADEHVESLETAGDVVWPLVDNLGTVRDLATYDSNTDVTTIANHHVYDAYGNRTSQTNSAVDCLFGYTARQYDEVSSLQNNLNRWYDAMQHKRRIGQILLLVGLLMAGKSGIVVGGEDWLMLGLILMLLGAVLMLISRSPKN